MSRERDTGDLRKTADVWAMPWDIMSELYSPKLSLKQRGQRKGQSTRLEDRLRMLCCLEVIDLLAPQVGLEPTTLRLTAESRRETLRSCARKGLKSGPE